MFVQGDAARDFSLAHGAGTHPDRTALDVVLSQMRLGMPLFFVLSGFLVFRPFAAAAMDRRPGPELGRYVTRRAARIAPAYWAAILIPAAVLAWLGHGEAQPIERLPVFLLFLQNYDPATSQHLNPPTWTIVVEVSFYVAVPLLAIAGAWATARIARPRDRRIVLAVGCVVLLVIGAVILGQTALHGPNHSPLKDSLLGRLASFAAGMLAAVLVHRRTASRGVASGIALLGIALVVLEGTVRGLSLGPDDLRDLLVDTPVSVGFALLIAAVALARVPGEQIVSRGPLQWYGRHSYGLYLWHFPVIYVLRSLEIWPDHLAVALAMTVAPATVLAVLSWHLLERPAIAWARRRTPARTRGPLLATAASGD